MESYIILGDSLPIPNILNENNDYNDDDEELEYFSCSDDDNDNFFI